MLKAKEQRPWEATSSSTSPETIGILIEELLASIKEKYEPSWHVNVFWIKAIGSNSMDLTAPWKANRPPVSQKIIHIPWNKEVHYRIHNSPPDQSTQSSHPTSWWSNLIWPSHLSLLVPGGLFPSNFPTKILYTPPLSSYVPHASPIS